MGAERGGLLLYGSVRRLRMYLVSERRMVFSVLFIVSWFLVTVYNTLIKRDYCKGCD